MLAFKKCLLVSTKTTLKKQKQKQKGKKVAILAKDRKQPSTM